MSKVAAKPAPTERARNFSDHRRLGAYVRISHENNGVAVVVYGGPISIDTFKALRKAAIKDVSLAAALLVDLRSVIPLGNAIAEIEDGVFLGKSSPPAALVTSPVHKALWHAYAVRAAMRGIVRGVFTDKKQAADWIEEFFLPHSARRTPFHEPNSDRAGS